MLRVDAHAVQGRRYSWYAPKQGRWAITLERPAASDERLLMAVAGTYTSPQDEVEGVVMRAGELLRADAKPWAGLLLIRDGQLAIQKAPGGKLSAGLLAQLKAQRASLLQGHLLVHRGEAQAFRDSPELARRAIVVGAEGAALVESQAAVALERFARDLAAMQVSAAMNLDMGGWSEGLMRLSDGSVQRFRTAAATARQSNWLLIVRPR